MSRDLVKDVKAYRDKHMDELRMIQSNISLDDGLRFDVLKSHLQPVIQIVLKFIHEKGYSVSDTKDIIKAIGFEISKPYMRIIKTTIRERLNNQQTKKEEVKQYPPRYTSSKPTQEKPITSTHKPKLNLSHIQQVHQPASVSPSENTRKPKLEISKATHTGRNNKTDYSIGVVKGSEADNRIFNAEIEPYKKALEVLKKKGTINQLPNRTGIHATNDARAAVRQFVPGRLTSWR